ncbi:zinc-ribbon domain-containing protein [Halostella pelagica]|uniref:zinc-ribbon domain-containing protein n=1 Tax=Halostella pelagica TaxID=2583824 RepID=UPI0010807F02|nr:zinc-ribbon domain-containing protein [Halostella pelagica]
MNSADSDPHCPECGEPIGQTATYCMHCSADLTAELESGDTNEDGAWDETGSPSAGTGKRTDAGESSVSTGNERPEQLLAPDGLVDNTLTVVVGIVGGIIVGLVGSIVLAVLTGSGWALAFGFVAWLGATAYLVRRRTVQGAVAKSGYAVAIVLLLVPVIALSPGITVDGGIEGRGGLLFVLFLFVAIPAGISAAIGWVAARFVPENAGGSEG